jgi:hypothetical protein
MKREIKVKTYDLSLWGLLDGRSPEEVKAELDRITNDHLSYIREGCTLRFDLSTGYDGELELALITSRQETDEEYAKRNTSENLEKERLKAQRLREYLKLKAEFEGDKNGT